MFFVTDAVLKWYQGWQGLKRNKLMQILWILKQSHENVKRWSPIIFAWKGVLNTHYSCVQSLMKDKGRWFTYPLGPPGPPSPSMIRLSPKYHSVPTAFVNTQSNCARTPFWTSWTCVNEAISRRAVSASEKLASCFLNLCYTV